MNSTETVSEGTLRAMKAAVSSDAFVAPPVDRREIGRLLGEHRAGRGDHGRRLWASLLVEEWFARRATQRPTSTP